MSDVRQFSDTFDDWVRRLLVKRFGCIPPDAEIRKHGHLIDFHACNMIQVCWDDELLGQWNYSNRVNPIALPGPDYTPRD